MVTEAIVRARSNVLPFTQNGPLSPRQILVKRRLRDRVDGGVDEIPVSYVAVLAMPNNEVELSVAEVEPDEVPGLLRGLREIADHLERYLATSRSRRLARL
jgi:hypothetical protein